MASARKTRARIVAALAIGLVGLGAVLAGNGRRATSAQPPLADPDRASRSSTELDAPALESDREPAIEGLAASVEETTALADLPGESSAEEHEAERETARLSLHLRNRATGEPVESWVTLWETGLPETAQFTAGDRSVAAVHVPQGVLELEVTPGIYRAVCGAQRRSAPDIEPFRVEWPATEVVLDVDLPKDALVVLSVVDDRGRPIDGARAERRMRPYDSRMQRAVRPRQPKQALFLHTLFCGPGKSREGRLRSPLPLILPFREHDLSGGVERTVGCVAPGHYGGVFLFEDMTMLAENEPLVDPVEEDWTGVLLPKGHFDDAPFLPDGTRAVDAGAEIRVRPGAISRSEGSWRDAVSRVFVEVPRYERLEFDYRLAEGSPASRILTARVR